MHILLFDIDGTLIRSGGAGKAAMEAGLASAFGITQLRDEVPYSGRTDSAIGIDLLRLHGIDPSSENLERLRSAYLAHLPASLRTIQGAVLPGVRNLLDRLQPREDVWLGLLTGNTRSGAECKLSHYDLWKYFPFGGFADGIIDRDDVARYALQQTADYLKRPIDPSRVWVIGDTPLDVRCARAIGAHAIAVATGWHSYDELLRSGADLVLRDLSDPMQLPNDWQ